MNYLLYIYKALVNPVAFIFFSCQEIHQPIFTGFIKIREFKLPDLLN
jgi:hypothetical protein